LQEAVRVGCTNPSKLYGMYPRKGALELGSDADVVLWDTTVQRTIAKAAPHDELDYPPYEGMQIQGQVVRTLLRGTTVYTHGGSSGSPAVADAPPRGSGAFVECGPPELLGWQGEWPDAGDVVAQRCVTTLGPTLDGVPAPALFADHPYERLLSSAENAHAGGTGVDKERKRPRVP